MEDYYLGTSGLSVGYNGKTLIHDINIGVRRGQVLTLIGPNGSGKTMLLRLMAGLILPTEGEVWIDGKKLGKDLDFPPSMGLMIENPAFLPNFTGRKNLELLAEIKKTPKGVFHFARIVSCDIGLLC